MDVRTPPPSTEFSGSANENNQIVDCTIYIANTLYCFAGIHLDIEQYYLDLQKANNSSNIMWENEYRSSDVFNIEDLTASSLEGLMDRLKDIDSEDFKHYRKYRSVSYLDSHHEYCDSKCHASMICEITHINVDEFNQCVQGSLTAGSSYPTKSIILATIAVQAVFILNQA